MVDRILKERNTKKGLKGMTITALENRYDRCFSKYQKANEKHAQSEALLAAMDFDIKQPNIDAAKLEKLQKERKYIASNLKIERRLMKQYLERAVETTKERERRTIKPKEMPKKSKFW